MADDTVEVDEVESDEIELGFNGDNVDRPFTAAEKRYLHGWSLDWKIEENERRFAQNEAFEQGVPPDLKQALADAGIDPPAPPVNPQFVSQPAVLGMADPQGIQAAKDAEYQPAVESPVDPNAFDEAAIREVLADYTNPELQSELKDRELSSTGNKEELTDRLVEALRAEHEAEQAANTEGTTE